MSSTSPPGRPRTSVVIGGSLAGMLAAAALAESGDVVVVERDALPDGPRPRRG
ncbi:pyridine nucleotide-disulfide oxidoreductase, partial [Streptomyces sp. NPDC048551]